MMMFGAHQGVLSAAQRERLRQCTLLNGRRESTLHLFQPPNPHNSMGLCKAQRFQEARFLRSENAN